MNIFWVATTKEDILLGCIWDIKMHKITYSICKSMQQLEIKYFNLQINSQHQ